MLTSNNYCKFYENYGLWTCLLCNIRNIHLLYWFD
jgi:hypothetical protein